ncbi:MAG: hypothetical protein KDE14_00935 [Rhodobacteraceae bacterium]|nr:hypothetical protein [Paracoccaceae bacterium]
MRTDCEQKDGINNDSEIDGHGDKVLFFPLKASHRLFRGRDMERIDQFDFYKMGRDLAHVMKLDETFGSTVTKGDAVSAVMQILRCCTGLLAGKPVKLVYSENSLRALKDAADKFWKEHFADTDGHLKDFDWNAAISPYDISKLKTAFRTFENNLAAELGRAATYYVPKRGIYDTHDLMNEALNQFSDEIRSKLSANAPAANDFRDAGRALAFDLPTASGIHAVRALEIILADYYKSFGLTPEKDMTIAKYLKGLRDVKGDRTPDPETIGWLDAIKDIDRNALMHGRKSLNFDDGVRIFNLVTGTMIAVLKELPAIPAAQDGKKLGLGSLLLASDKAANQ